MAPAIQCTSCGESQTPDARFCPRCGTRIAAAAPPADGDPFLGKVISDRYLLTERIGKGASGTIYRAEHTSLGRKMALKILHPQLSRDDAAVERFRREATTVGQIDNDHIVQVVDFGQTEDRLFFVMELLEGETLGAVLARERTLSIDRARKILLQIADALGVAHQLGYIHRDLRPRNVFLSVRRGEPDFVKLLDFGLAKLQERDAVTKQTALGMQFGDPRYMSPEQARGDAIDPRSDVFSLGVVAYEMLSGVTPFIGTGPFDVLQKVLDSPTPHVLAVRPDCPPWLDEVVHRALQKKPQDRFERIDLFMACLRVGRAPNPAIEPRSSSTPTVPNKIVPPDVAAAAAALAAAVAPVVPVIPVSAERTEPTTLPEITIVPPIAPAVPPTLPSSEAVPVPSFGFDETNPGRKPRAVIVPLETVAGEVEANVTSEPPRTPTSSIVVDDALKGEPTGPQRLGGDDGWFNDRAPTNDSGVFDEVPARNRRPMVIGVIAGAVSLGVFALLLLWPHAKPADPRKLTPLAATPVAPPAPTVAVPAVPVVPPSPPPPAAAPEVPEPVVVNPEPVVAKPEPVAVNPEPVVAKPEPVVAKPEPVVAKPEPVVARPEPVVTRIEHPAAKPEHKPEPDRARPEPARVATGKSASSPRPRPDSTPPKEFKDPFAPKAAATGGQVDAFVKSGRQKLAAGDLSQAQGAFSKARDLDPRNSDAYAGLGEVAFEQGDYSAATVQLKQALRLSPNRARFLILLGQSYYKVGRAKEAVQEYRRALKVDPASAEAQRSLELAERKLAQGN